MIIENLGVFECAKYEIGDLTVVCGKNNTGKTVAAYTLYGFFDYWRNRYDFQIAPSLMWEIQKRPALQIVQTQIQRLFVKNLKCAYKKYISEWLPKVLGISPERLTDCTFRLDICWIHSQSLFLKNKTIHWAQPNHELFTIKTDDEGKNVQIFHEREYVPQEFVSDSIQSLATLTSPEIIPCAAMMSADRIGAALFAEEIRCLRNNMRQQKNSSFKPAIYPLPAENSLNTEKYCNMICDSMRRPSSEKTELQIIFDQLLEGSFEVHQQQLYFTPFRTKNLPLSLSETSSSVRSLLPLWLQLYSCAVLRETPATMFMIDEPEMNLHPENQRILARIFARLVNQGYKIYITTHSDYIVKELNALIMLYRRNKNNKYVMERYGYSEKELLDPARVRIYTTQQVPFSKTKMASKQIAGEPSTPKYIFVQAKIDELGIRLPTFDDTINEMNTIQDEILAGD